MPPDSPGCLAHLHPAAALRNGRPAGAPAGGRHTQPSFPFSLLGLTPRGKQLTSDKSSINKGGLHPPGISLLVWTKHPLHSAMMAHAARLPQITALPLLESSHLVAPLGGAGNRLPVGNTNECVCVAKTCLVLLSSPF